MALPTPMNGEDGAYTANAVLSALLDLLIEKGIIDHADVAALMRQVTQRLSKENNSASQRAAAFLSEGDGS